VTADQARPDLYGIAVQEAYGRSREAVLARKIVSARATKTRHLVEYVVAAVRASGHRATALGPHRRDPIKLDEAAGVRLALILLATGPLNRGDRVRAVAAGVAAMSVEETYYWYALCVGPRASAARRAIRTLLSDV
jgi:hypothetical protein